MNPLCFAVRSSQTNELDLHKTLSLESTTSINSYSSSTSDYEGYQTGPKIGPKRGAAPASTFGVVGAYVDPLDAAFERQWEAAQTAASKWHHGGAETQTAWPMPSAQPAQPDPYGPSFTTGL